MFHFLNSFRWYKVTRSYTSVRCYRTLKVRKTFCCKWHDRVSEVGKLDKIFFQFLTPKTILKVDLSTGILNGMTQDFKGKLELFPTEIIQPPTEKHERIDSLRSSKLFWHSGNSFRYSHYKSLIWTKWNLYGNFASNLRQ